MLLSIHVSNLSYNNHIIITNRIHADVVQAPNGHYISPPPQHEGVLIQEHEKQPILLPSRSAPPVINATTSHISSHGQSNSSCHSSFFSTQPRHVSSSRNQNSFTGFVGNGSNNHNYAKISSTLQPVAKPHAF